MSGGQLGEQVVVSEPAHTERVAWTPEELLSQFSLSGRTGEEVFLFIEGPVGRTVGQKTKPGSRIEEKTIEHI